MSFSAANIKTTLDNTNIVLPQQMKSIDRLYQFSTNTNLVANSVYTGNAIDCSTYKKLCGHIAANQAGTLYVQQSDDGSSNWLTVQTTAVAISTQTSINSVSYYNAIQYEVNITSKWARVIYVNGATAQTYFLFSGYTTPL